MTHAEAITRTQEFIRNKFRNDPTGHDYWHMYRVWQLSRQIAAGEPTADLFTVELAAWLHDIGDWKFTNNDPDAGPKAARKWLTELQVDPEVIEKVEHIVRHISFKGEWRGQN